MREAFTLNSFDDIENSNSILWAAVKKELPNIMKNELTQKQQECVQGIFFEGLNQVTVAEKLGISQPTASRHIHRAMKILLNRLNYAMRVGKTISEYYENKK